MTDIMLFAAGLGTRMRPLTDDRPKPLVRVGETTLLDHALDLTKVGGIGRCVVNVHYKADQIRAHLAARSVSISDETDLLRDTGGGLKLALPLLQGDPVITLNTDAIWSAPNPVSLLMAAWQPHMTCLLMVVPLAQTLGHPGQGDFDITGTGQLARKGAHVYTGLQMIRRSAVSAINDTVFSMNRVWDAAAEQGGLFGTIYPGRWCDVGQPSSIPLAETLMEASADV